VNEHRASSGQADADTVQNRNRFLIVSLGSIGARHLRNLRVLQPDAEIAVLRRPSSASQVVEGADRVIYDLEQALAFAPKAAIIASPASQHMSFALRLAEAGVHLFIEKPLAAELDDCENLIRLCRERKLTLAVGYTLRFLPSLRALREIVLSGEIGDVFAMRVEVGQYLPDWRKGTDYRQGVSARKELGGGVLLELSHEIDYVLWMFGMPSRVTALGGRSGQLECEVEDIVEVVMEYEAPRRIVSVHLDMLQRRPFRCCRAVGTRGSARWDGIADTVDVDALQADLPASVPGVALADKNQVYQEELLDFFASIASGGAPVCTGEQGLQTLVVVEAIRHSLANGCAVIPGSRVGQ
jgi:predicted dehydrogenase